MDAASKDPWIIFDLDDVLVNLRQVVQDVLRRRLGKDIPWEHWDTYDFADTYKEPVEKVQRILLENRIFQEAKVEEGAHAILQEIKDMGYRIGILTARGWHPTGRVTTEMYLFEERLPVDRLELVSLGEPKHEAISRFPGEIHLFVDDNADHVRGCTAAGIKSLCRDRPWNRGAPDVQRILFLRDVLLEIENRKTREQETQTPCRT